MGNNSQLSEAAGLARLVSNTHFHVNFFLKGLSCAWVILMVILSKCVASNISLYNGILGSFQVGFKA